MPADLPTTDDLHALRQALLDWWAAHGRDLPWRASRDPWAVLVSEIMLQQTQVPRVIDRWQRFLDRFPTLAACAAAPVGEVIEEWAGLGYNRRAVFLHRAATDCVARHDATLPNDLDALLALPGIGPYTARAVLVFAYERDIGLVDTNAGRFVARALAGRALRPAEAQRVADAAVPEGWGWTWGQAVFDLGASHCTKRAPTCDRCPISARCTWWSAGAPAPDPVEGSAGISAPQSRFEGSDRQGRGRLLDALRAGPIPVASAAATTGWDDDERVARAISSLVADGLAVLQSGWLALPGSSDERR